jgi:flagellin
MLSIQTNVNSMNAQENLRMTNLFQGRTITRLTSGYRINEAGDDAAGLGVANVYRSDVAELVQGVRNANDGLSTLQIVDGGLNNISKMLDRLKTLATQSASATFTGDRNTLNKEYQDILTEIDRQAGMVGLGTGTMGARNNTDIAVYVGGSQQGSAKVVIELGGAANRVDAAGLKLTGSSIAGGALSTIGSTKDISSADDLLASSGTQSFSFRLANVSGTVTATVTGDSDGITSGDALSQLNSQLSDYGISAALDSDGQLAFSGTSAFTVTTTTAAADALTQVATLTGKNDAMSRQAGAAAWADVAGSNEVITMRVNGAEVSTTLAVGTDQAAALTQLNSAFNSMGIHAVAQADGTGIEFQSSKSFEYKRTGGGATGVFAADQATFASATDPSGSASTTSAAEAAIKSVQSAVTSLGLVQGKVGSAQNKLSYAIQLAQSQITSFSAAESRIRDADVAQEAANLTKAQVLQQASLAALAQANSAPQAVLSLLRG